MTSIHEAVMAERRRDLAAIAAASTQRIVFLGFPIYPNIGDLLIHAGAEAFFRDYGYEVTGRYANADLGRMDGDGVFRLGRRIAEVDRQVGDGAAIVFQGGGNFGDLWPEHQRLREAVVRRYAGVRITVMPQSVCFENPRNFDLALEVFSARDVHVFCRDAASLESLSGKIACSLAPDMAHQLWGRIVAPPIEGPPTRLIQSRNDSERIGPRPAAAFDWHDLLSPKDHLFLNGLVAARRLSRGKMVKATGDWLWQRLSKRWISRAVGRLAQAEVVETDRLHGLILGALLSRPVLYRDNSYGKLDGYARAWLADSPLVRRVAEAAS